MTRLVVVGGGIAGLVAAHHAHSRGGATDIVVLDAAAGVGGKAQTAPFAGVELDSGPDAFLARAREARDLCEELGIAAELVSPATRSASVLLDGRLRPLPPGLVLGVPVSADALVGRGVLDDAAIDRVRAEPTLTPEPPDVLAQDESVGGFLRRRMGDAVVERLVGPLLGGVSAGPVDELSIEAGTPQLAEARRRGGSFVDALRAVARESNPDPAAPVFLAHPLGMGHLVDCLVASLPTGSVRAGVSVRGVARGGRDVPWTLDTTAGTLTADAVVLAVPSFVSAPWLEALAPVTAAEMAELEWASVALVSLAYPRAAVADPLDGSGFLVPAPELGGAGGPDDGLLTACSWASSKWAHLRGNGETVLFRASAGRYGDERALGLTDDELVWSLSRELAPVLGIAGGPTLSRVTRWRRSLPQYRPGHLGRVDRWDAEMADATPGLALAGASLRGLGIPAIIASARVATDRALGRMA